MLDSQLVFAEAQAVTAIGDNASTNEITFANSVLGDAGQTQENLWVQALCSTAVTSAGAATVQAVLQDSSDNATWVDVVAGPVIGKAALLAGTVMLAVQPPPGMLQYWRISWRIATAVLTAGAFDAFVSNTIQRNVPTPIGFVVA
jgi:hypothetical protein